MTLEELKAVGTFQVTPETIWDGDDCDYALEKHDWERRFTIRDAPGPAPTV